MDFLRAQARRLRWLAGRGWSAADFEAPALLMRKLDVRLDIAIDETFLSSLPGAAAGAPSPHRSSRWGEGWGEGQVPAQTARLIVARRCNECTPKALTCLCPSP